MSSLAEQDGPDDAGAGTALQSVEVEQLVIGACMAYPQVMPEFAAYLEPGHFFDAAHRAIWAVLLERFGTNQPYFPEFVMRDLKASPTFKAGPDGVDLKYVSRLAADARLSGAPTHAAEYAEAIIDAARRRALLEVTRSVQADLLADVTVDAGSISDRATAALGVALDGFAGNNKREGSLLEAVEEYANRDAPRTSTGLVSLDAVIGGFERGGYTVLGGRPSMGKTALAIWCCYKAAKRGEAALFFSSEMVLRQVGFRLASMILHHEDGLDVSYMGIRVKGREHPQWDAVRSALARADALPLHIVSSAGMGADDVRATVQRHRMRAGLRGAELGLVAVDYLQNLAWPRGEQNAVQAATKNSQAMKRMAVQLDLPVLALAQLSRGVETRPDKRPLMSDLRESGGIEQDADVIAFMYRDYYYLRNEAPLTNPGLEADRRATMDECEFLADVIFAKQRDGATKTVKVGCNMKLNTYWDTVNAPADPGLF